jgi:hypothetical protein
MPSIQGKVCAAAAGLLALSVTGRAELVSGSGSSEPYVYGTRKSLAGGKLEFCDIAALNAWGDTLTGNMNTACNLLNVNVFAPTRAHFCGCYNLVPETSAKENLDCKFLSTEYLLYDVWHACHVDNIQPEIATQGKAPPCITMWMYVEVLHEHSYH